MTQSKENPLAAAGVRAFEPENNLRGKLGKDVDMRRDLFTPEKIAQCQQVLDIAAEDFFKDNMPEVEAMHQACSHMEKHPEDHARDVKAIEDQAFRMRGQSEALGYSLVAMVCQSLFHYCKEKFRDDEAGYTVVRKHIDVLRVAFAQSLKGDGGAMGQELTKSLQLLIRKFQRD